MKEFKGTQGIWIASEDWDNDRLVVHQEDGIQWHVCYTPEYTIDNEQTKANANIIAAAPELLSSLQALLYHYKELVNSGDCGNWNPDDELVCKNADRIINKAIGL